MDKSAGTEAKATCKEQETRERRLGVRGREIEGRKSGR
jgi:hypothetical protein